MIELWWIGVAVIGLVLAFRLLGPGKFAEGIDQARETGEVAGIVAAVEGKPEKKHPNLWDQAIGTLWQEYHREAALTLMVAAARRSDAPIVQFWLKKALDVEPELAEEQFSEEFLEEFYRPGVAASCGRVSCCM